MKYNFELDMESVNSNSLILKQIKPCSKVLEMGPAYGRMTKYMKETLNCDICIVEIDREAGSCAKKWASRSFIGKDSGNGNIDDEIWHYNLSTAKESFDYIIFADVLEHLYDPWLALKRATSLLKSEGSILISVPNFAHNAVLINILAHDKFDYRSTGLLDSTHIRFFTRTTLNKMVEGAALKVKQTFDPCNSPENTEFNNFYDDLPNDVSNFLKSRPDGEVYQFVWELKHA